MPKRLDDRWLSEKRCRFSEESERALVSAFLFVLHCRSRTGWSGGSLRYGGVLRQRSGGGSGSTVGLDIVARCDWLCYSA